MRATYRTMALLCVSRMSPSIMYGRFGNSRPSVCLTSIHSCRDQEPSSFLRSV